MVSRAPDDAFPSPPAGDELVGRLRDRLAQRLPPVDWTVLRELHCTFEPPDLFRFESSKPCSTAWLESRFGQRVLEAAALVIDVRPRVEFRRCGGRTESAASTPVSFPGSSHRESMRYYYGANGTRATGPLEGSPFSPHLRFDNLIVGGSNHLAHAAACAVGESPGDPYNPLFIQGSRGVGKTHLFHALGHELVEAGARRGSLPRVSLFNAESFTTAFVESATAQDGRFHARCIETDALFLDDVHFLATKRKTLAALAALVDAFVEHGKQVVISGIYSPRETKGLPERLVARIVRGLTTSIKPPDTDMKIARLHLTAWEHGIELPGKVAEFVAQRVNGNFHELDGAFRLLASVASARREPIRIETARSLLDGNIEIMPITVRVTEILETTAEYFHLRPRDLVARTKARSVTRPRQIAMYLARKLTPLSLSEIGMQFGGRDHTTVLYGVRRVGRLVEEDPQINSTVELLRSLLSTPS